MAKRRSSSSSSPILTVVRGVFVTIVSIVILAVGAILKLQQGGDLTTIFSSTTSTTIPNSQPISNSMPSGGKQTPKEITFHGCPPEGDGGDPVLNRNKNRVDDGNYQPMAFDSLLNLPWPQDVAKKSHDEWST